MGVWGEYYNRHDAPEGCIYDENRYDAADRFIYDKNRYDAADGFIYDENRYDAADGFIWVPVVAGGKDCLTQSTFATMARHPAG